MARRTYQLAFLLAFGLYAAPATAGCSVRLAPAPRFERGGAACPIALRADGWMPVLLPALLTAPRGSSPDIGSQADSPRAWVRPLPPLACVFPESAAPSSRACFAYTPQAPRAPPSFIAAFPGEPGAGPRHAWRAGQWR